MSGKSVGSVEEETSRNRKSEGTFREEDGI
jgi:hypothetical protein